MDVATLVGVLVGVAVATKNALNWRFWLKSMMIIAPIVMIRPTTTPEIIQMTCRSGLGNNIAGIRVSAHSC